jgi:membrane-associated phospholipid phosphatase
MVRFAFGWLGRVAGASVRRMATAPLRLGRTEWAATAAFAALVGVAVVRKRELQALFEERRAGRALAATVSRLGEGRTMTVLVLALLLAGLASSRKRVVEGAVVLAVALAWAYLLAFAGDWVLGEARPVEGGAMHWFSRGHGVSGHAAAASALFFPIRDVLAGGLDRRGRALVTASLVAWISLVGWARVSLGMHYVWNVLLGCGLGLFVGGEVSAASAGRRPC